MPLDGTTVMYLLCCMLWIALALLEVEGRDLPSLLVSQRCPTLECQHATPLVPLLECLSISQIRSAQLDGWAPLDAATTCCTCIFPDHEIGLHALLIKQAACIQA